MFGHPSVHHPSVPPFLPSFPPRLFPGSGQELLHKPAIHLLLRREASINMSTLFAGVFKAQPVILLKINKGYPQQQQIRNIPERSRHDTTPPRSRIIAGGTESVFLLTIISSDFFLAAGLHWQRWQLQLDRNQRLTDILKKPLRALIL